MCFHANPNLWKIAIFGRDIIVGSTILDIQLTFSDKYSKERMFKKHQNLCENESSTLVE
jgi:hypothetical protein